MFEDTYFLDQKRAIEVAKEQNRRDAYTLQVCYYNGDKLDINLPNLIHLPFDNLIEGLAQGIHRLHTKIDLSGLNLSQAIKHEIYKNFNIALQKAQALRDEYNKAYQDRLKNYEPNFDEKPWRFYLPAHASTRVMQYVSKAIADTLKDLGYEVLFDLDYGINDIKCVKNIFLFRPHSIVKINHFISSFINKKVFGFTWFQDMMPILYNDQKIVLRKRDYVFSLLHIFDEKLKEKGVPCQRQGFCINDKVYKIDNSIKREKKIVFIGSSYLKTIPNRPNIKNATIELEKLYKNGMISNSDIPKYISTKYNIDLDFVISRLMPYIIRDISLLELIKIKSDYKIEIYGWGWKAYEELKPYYKGALKYGKKIAKVYSSTTFAFAPHLQYTLQQRIFESAACGAIPIVYDCREFSKEESFEEALCYFKTIKDLEKILNDDVPKKDFTNLLKNNTYKSFAEKIIKIMEDNIK